MHMSGPGNHETAALNRGSQSIRVNHRGSQLAAIPKNNRLARKIRARNRHCHVAGAYWNCLWSNLADAWVRFTRSLDCRCGATAKRNKAKCNPNNYCKGPKYLQNSPLDFRIKASFSCGISRQRIRQNFRLAVLRVTHYREEPDKTVPQIGATGCHFLVGLMTLPVSCA